MRRNIMKTLVVEDDFTSRLVKPINLSELLKEIRSYHLVP
jgi:hypothetical protein